MNGRAIGEGELNLVYFIALALGPRLSRPPRVVRQGRPGHSNIGDAFSEALILPILSLEALFCLLITEDSDEKLLCKMIAVVVGLRIYDIEQFHHF